MSVFHPGPASGLVPQEYIAPLSAIQITEELLLSSPLEGTLSYLKKCEQPRAEVVLASLIRKAFGLKTEGEAQSLHAKIPEFDVDGILYSMCERFLLGLSWEGPFVRAALQIIIETETPESLKLTIGFIAHAHDKCSSRRRAVVCSILSRISPTSDCGATSQDSVLDQIRIRFPSTATASELMAAVRLHSLLASFVHDLKDKAFESTFVQPFLQYATASGGHVSAYLNTDGFIACSCFSSASRP